MRRPVRLSEAIGLWAGYVVGPLFGVGAIVRHARVFHPGGIVLQAQVSANRDVKPPFLDLAKNLSGAAFVRLSTAVWKTESPLPDVLGCAIRFRTAADPQRNYEEGKQDLLFITSESLLKLPMAFLKTDHHNFFANTFYGLSPFEVAGQLDMWLRLVPAPINLPGKNRMQKLRQAVEQGIARFQLEVSPHRDSSHWVALVEIQLTKPLDIDQQQLRFSAFRSELGIRPQGFLHFLREGPYIFSQFARSKAN